MNSSRRITLGIELIDEPGWMGGTLYLRNLALSLARLPAGERPRIRLLGSAPAVAAVVRASGSPSLFANQRGENLTSRFLRRLGWRSRGSDTIDVVYPGFGSGWPGAVTIHWVPDFQHRHLPAMFQTEEIAARDKSIGAIASTPGVVVFSSQVAAEDFRRFFPDHVATPRIWHFCSLIAPKRTPSDSSPKILGNIPDKYLYLPNQFWVHKNHTTVLKALALLREKQQLKIPLVCTGAQSDRRNVEHFNNLRGFIREKGLGDQIHLLGLLARDEQVEVLRRAAAIVQPSQFEGWSTVVEDARAIGRPIFLSDIPVHREQNPPAAHFFHPESAEELATLLATNWTSLKPGPDPTAERSAKAKTDERVLSSAREFCSIVGNAITLKRQTNDPAIYT